MVASLFIERKINWNLSVSGTPLTPQSSACQDPVQTPCTGVCTLGPGDLCLGCLRSSDEIENWLNYSAHHRNRVMNELPSRLQSLFAR